MATDPPVLPSPEATRALADAVNARVSNEASLPLALEVSRRVRDQVEANHFLDLIDGILRQAAHR